MTPAAEQLVKAIDRFALRTRATPVATAQAIAQMVRVAIPHIEREAAERKR